MRIDQLLHEVPLAAPAEKTDTEVSSLAFDSRKVQPGGLYFCLRGTREDGHAYAPQAAAAGAAALVVEEKVPVDIPQIIVPDAREALARISAHFYGDPARKLSLIGITGTNGKTSMTYMVKSIAEASGRKVGLIGTTGNMIGDQKIPGQMTTPDPIEFNELLAKMCSCGVSWVSMEVSAHALDLRKLAGIPFRMAVFSNLSQDHLDYFGTMEHYRDVKEKLFTPGFSQQAVLNMDDETGRYYASRTAVPYSGYALTNAADFQANDLHVDAWGMSYRMNLLGQSTQVNLKLTGLFNAYNSLGAAAACYLMGVSAPDIKAGLEGLAGVNGRLETVPVDADFSVIVDYAHTPDALCNVLDTVRGFCSGRIITVFGCGGDRDRTKRPLMGEAAGKRADFCMITSDNPRSEEPEAIIAEILPGVQRTGCAYDTCADRREAIFAALKMAKKGDVVLIAGKGHETYQIIGKETIHFDDREVVREYFEQQ